MRKIKTNTKQFFCILLALFLTLMGMTSCYTDPIGSDQSSDKPQESAPNAELPADQGNPTVPQYPDLGECLTIIENGQAKYYIVRPQQLAPELQNILWYFVDELQKKTGIDFAWQIITDTTQAKEAEILFGDVKGRENVTQTIPLMSYTGSGIQIIGETITVSVGDANTAQRVITQMLEAICQNEKGDWVLPKSFNVFHDKSTATVQIPYYQTENGVYQGLYSCGGGNYEVSYSGTDQEEYEAYLALLETSGFTQYTTNAIGNNLFSTHVASDANGKETEVHTMFYPKSKVCKIVYGGRGYLPAAEPVAEETAQNLVTPSITQIGRVMTYASAPGMSYIIQLADASFIIIDGGPTDSAVIPKYYENGEWKVGENPEIGDVEGLYNFLCDNTPGDGNPVIAAWFITHAHGDHVGLANSFLSRYSKQVELKLAAYNFPDFYNITIENESALNMASLAKDFQMSADYLNPESETWIFHTGQKIFFTGCEIEIIYTHEDFYPNELPWGNHTSSAFRVTLGETTFMVLGDCEASLCQQMADTYGEELKSDILQLSHHGFNGACIDLYQYIDPAICFWACDDYRFWTDGRCLGTQGGYYFNYWLRNDSVRQREHYTANVTTTIYC